MPIQPLPPDHPAMALLIEALGIQAEPILANHAPMAEYRDCYAAVDRVAERPGFTAVVGWRVLWLPDRMIFPEHHAIVRFADGDHLDLTPVSEDGVSLDATTFLPDGRFPIDLDALQLPPSALIALVDVPLARQLVAAHQASIEAQNAFYRSLARQGVGLRGLRDNSPAYVAAMRHGTVTKSKRLNDQAAARYGRLFDRFDRSQPSTG